MPNLDGQSHTPLTLGQPIPKVIAADNNPDKLLIVGNLGSGGEIAPFLELAELLSDRIGDVHFSSAYLAGTPPTQEQTYYWLSWLDSKLKQDNSPEFLIERMQPAWLETPQQKWFYQISVGLITGAICGLIYGMTTGLIGALIGGISYGIILALTPEIYPIQNLKISLEFAKVALVSTVLEGLWWGIIYGIIDAFICWLIWGIEGLIWGMIQVIIWGLIEGLIWGLTIPEFNEINTSNQGIKESAKNAVIFTFIGGGSWFLLYMLVNVVVGKTLPPLEVLLDTISSGLFFGIYVGGLACIQHFVLRLILWRSGSIPWNYTRFLNYASDLGLLEREGGCYRFIIKFAIQ